MGRLFRQITQHEHEWTFQKVKIPPKNKYMHNLYTELLADEQRLTISVLLNNY
jgi:hypothetical protein